MRKKLLAFICFGSTSILALSSIIFSSPSLYSLKADVSGQFSLLCNDILHYSLNKATVYTTNNNPIVLKTSGSDGNKVVRLDNNEYLTNESPLSGIKGLNISWTGGELMYATSFETKDEAYLSYNNATSGVMINIDDNVNYFTLKSLSNNLQIDSVYIIYSCQYSPKSYTVSFDSNGGSSIASVQANSLSTLAEPTAPTKIGFDFAGWYLDPSLTNAYDFSSKVNHDFTLYAKYSEQNSVITLNSPVDGDYIDLRNAYITDFLDNYSKGYSLKYQSYNERYKNNEILFSWSSTVACDYYELDISLDPSFTTYDSYLVDTTSYSLANAYTGVTYYWQVKGFKNNVVYISRDIRSVETANYPRTLDISGVYNSRDIGGYRTDNGTYVKQGMVYRSARFDEIDNVGRNTMLNYLHVKSDLDLRKSGEGTAGTSSPLGDSVNYYNISFPYWTSTSGTGVNQKANWPAIKSAIEKFANSSFYPASFHCSIGQDRTGSLAIMLEAILGMSYHDIIVDYEFSSFTSVTYDGHTTITDRFTYQVDPLIDFFRTYGPSGASFRTCVTNFLTGGYNSLEGVGVSSSTINAIRNILLEVK